MKHRVVIPILFAVALFSGTARAQSWVVAPPLYGTFHLTTGFTPDPHSVYVEAGGTSSAAALGTPGNCVGMIMIGQPDVRVHYTAGTTYPLRFYVESGGDTTLIVNGPDGSWHCNDDAVGVNPIVDFHHPTSGQYDIWVGVWNSTAIYPATLHITEVLSNGPYGATPTASSSSPPTNSPSQATPSAMSAATAEPTDSGTREYHYQSGDLVTRANIGVDLLSGIGEESQFLEELSLPISIGVGYYPADRVSADLDAQATIHGDEGFTDITAGLGSHFYVIPELFLRAAAPVGFDPLTLSGLLSAGVDIPVSDGTSVTTEVGVSYPFACDSEVSCGGGAMTFTGGTAFSF